MKIGIIGANGYTGYELMRLLANHPRADVVYAGSRSMAGRKVPSLYPALSGVYDELRFESPNASVAAKKCDIVFTALPHGLSAEMGAELIKLGCKVIDLSADFRYDSIPLFEKTYEIAHPCPGLNEQKVYGLCELNRKKIVKSTKLVANPGCYPTASILALYPLLAEKVISPDGIIIDAKSGASGAGRKADEAFSYCESSSNFKAYAVTTHRHTSEIEEKLSAAALSPVALNFTPHLLPVKRGILATVYANLVPAAEKRIADVYKAFYEKEPFVKVNPEGEMPELKFVVGSNICRIGYKVDLRTKKVIIVSVIDNLIKGASGQAIQNMNIMYSLDERMGLPAVGNQL
ncbi:MAG: N-acetyl-gamma-glutamyl-phosphate reductase [Firmicutes bacterium]|nr:N-acetyl-gamma-glutamyl-phosphate reductase [Bacillota bacterium]